MRSTFTVLVLCIGLLLTTTTQIFAQSVETQATAGQVYLPWLANGKSDDSPNTPVTPSPTVPATEVPTSTPTPLPTTTPQPSPQQDWIFAAVDWKTASASIQVDAAGGLHLGYYFYESWNGTAPTHAVYLYCASQCADGVHWAGADLVTDRDVEEVQLRLNDAGQPRMLIVARADNGNKDFLYAACDQQCTQTAQWEVAQVASAAEIDISSDTSPQHSFALDPQGRPRFVYYDRTFSSERNHIGSFYAYCDHDCTQHTTEQPTWFETRISKEDAGWTETINYPSLAFTQHSHPRLVGELYSINSDPSGLYYLACDGGCAAESNWQRIYLGDTGGGVDRSWDLEIDAQDRPHVAFYQGDIDGQGKKLNYLFCAANCLSARTQWQANEVGLVKTSGKHPDLEVNGQNQPRIVYIDDQGGLGYAWCNTGCENGGPFQQTTIESGNDLYQLWPVLYPPTCDGGLWNGLTPVLALDAAGNPRIAFDATYHARCWWDDPGDGDPATYKFHLIQRVVHAIFFSQPE